MNQILVLIMPITGSAPSTTVRRRAPGELISPASPRAGVAVGGRCMAEQMKSSMRMLVDWEKQAIRFLAFAPGEAAIRAGHFAGWVWQLAFTVTVTRAPIILRETSLMGAGGGRHV